MTDYKKAFITEVNFKRSVNNQKLLEEKHQVDDAVNQIGERVNEMIYKQRDEYMVAYEQHMFTVQKQIHLLREKLKILTQDETRFQRIQLLNLQQSHFDKDCVEWDKTNKLLNRKLNKLNQYLKEQGLNFSNIHPLNL
jgi:hypothetical protein